MAEQEVLAKFEEITKCYICLDTYTDPKQLQCHHVFCQGCLVKLLSQKGGGPHVLTCPNCRHVTPLPANGVAGLQAAFQTSSLLDVQETLKRVLARKEGASVMVSKATPCCSEHPQEEIKLYCKDCAKFGCIKCVISGGEHISHSYKLLEYFKDEIMSSLEPLKEKLAMTDVAVRKIEARCGEISNQQASVEASINEFVEQLHETLDKKRSDLIAQLHQLADNKLNLLDSQKALVEKSQLQLQQCENNICEKLQQMTDDREVVKMKDDFTAQVDKLMSEFEPDILMPNSIADMEFFVAENLVTLCQKFGVLSASELHPDPSKCFITSLNCDLKSVVVNTPVVFAVQVRDYFNMPYLPHEVRAASYRLECRLVSEITGLEVWVQQENQCELTLMPTLKGPHQLHVKLNDRHIRGSPFMVHVKSSFEYLGPQISSINDVGRPWGIVVNKEGEIVVSESSRHCISVFSPDGRKLRSFGTQGSGYGQFKKPYGIALTDSENILVADHGNHRIQMFTPEGQFLKGVVSKGMAKFQPNSVAFNTYNKMIYVTDKTGYIQVFTIDLIHLFKFGGRSYLIPEDGRFGTDTLGITIDCDGHVYVSDTEYGRIQIFSSEGIFLKVIGKYYGGQFNRPVGIAFDSGKHYIYVSNQCLHDISVVNDKGVVVKRIGGRENESSMSQPRGIAIDQHDILYVCDYDNDCICMY